MYELLDAGIVQRNVDAQIGVSAQLVCLPKERGVEDVSDDDEAPDWCPLIDHTTPADDPSPPSVPDPSGGVTPEPAPAPTPVPQPSGGSAQQFRVCTFGVAKLSMAWKGRNAGANDIHAAWLPTKGAAHRRRLTTMR